MVNPQIIEIARRVKEEVHVMQNVPSALEFQSCIGGDMPDAMQSIMKSFVIQDAPIMSYERYALWHFCQRLIQGMGLSEAAHVARQKFTESLLGPITVPPWSESWDYDGLGR